MLSYVAAGNYVGEMALLVGHAAHGHGARRGRDRDDRPRRRALQGGAVARTRRCAAELEARSSSSGSRANAAMEAQPSPGNLIAS